MTHMSEVIERCPTGIHGFDKLCEGGLVKSSTNAIAGGPGSGKSTFLMQFLWNGIHMHNENGLYISFEPSIDDIFKDANTFGWNFSKFDEQGKCKFVKMSPNQDLLNDLRAQLTELVSKYEVKRLAIDPINLLTFSMGDTDVRGVIFELTALLKRLGVTSVLSTEISEGVLESTPVVNGAPREDFIKFLADGVINLYSSGLGGVSDRAIRITKMRRTNHIRGPVPFEIKENGITVIPQ